MPSPSQNLQAFVRLSMLLTGFSIPVDMHALNLFERIRGGDGQYQAVLDGLLSDQRWGAPLGEEELLELLQASTDRKLLARGLTYLWYTGDLLQWTKLAHDELRPESLLTAATPPDFYAGLMWQAISAHPPALSGGYYGHWHYQPEN
ncbi:hypothetical protein [Hymenobacter sp. BT559]|uniref:hypothetical protein n=1 Tax=Hymenobacter sp. BT559 TaxID=2795729 RepID=UPI0018EBC67C|nr:hypothetical protein [Hymenobacter sp. BT559]MBJ6146284.1 hypothetical protein [Hymenobacter sp. BT559]